MKKYFCLLAGLALLLPATVFGAEFRLADKSLVSSETIKDNLYAVGGNLNLSGTIEGDLIVAGGTINMLGTVTGDVLILGGTININGRIGQDLRIMGGNVTVNGQIGGELISAGGQIEVLSGATIVRGAYLASGQAVFNGSVGQNLQINASEVTLGSEARVGGNFDYYSGKAGSLDAGAKISGTTVFHPQEIKKPAYTHKFPWLAFLTFWWLAGVVGAIILACLIFYLWTKESEQMITAAFASPLRELVRGFVLLFIIPIAILVCLLTVIGLPLAAVAGFGYGVLTVLGAAVSSLLAASLISKFLFKKKETDLNWWLISLGVLAIGLIKIIPFIGWVVAFLVYLVALGVLGNKLYGKLLSDKK